MNHLRRELAPISSLGWEAIDDEVKSRLPTYLAARKLVDFTGPQGWTHSATNLGRTSSIPGPIVGVAAAQRQVLPLMEIRAEFNVSRAQLDDVERGATDPDFPELDEAARQVALAENVTVFQGHQAGGLRGITESTSHQPIMLNDVARYPDGVARAVNILRTTGVDGPYGLAICPDVYTQIVETAEYGGHLLFDHLREILGGPLVWSPGVEGGVIVSLRGGDFEFESGQDLSVGYLDHNSDDIQLYIEESFSFRVLEPDAAVILRPGS